MYLVCRVFVRLVPAGHFIYMWRHNADMRVKYNDWYTCNMQWHKKRKHFQVRFVPKMFYIRFSLSIRGTYCCPTGLVIAVFAVTPRPGIFGQRLNMTEDGFVGRCAHHIIRKRQPIVVYPYDGYVWYLLCSDRIRFSSLIQNVYTYVLYIGIAIKVFAS